MAAQPKPIGLAELVTLVYRADWTRLGLSASVHARHDLALRSRMSNVQATGEPLPGLLGRWSQAGYFLKVWQVRAFQYYGRCWRRRPPLEVIGS